MLLSIIGLSCVGLGASTGFGVVELGVIVEEGVVVVVLGVAVGVVLGVVVVVVVELLGLGTILGSGVGENQELELGLGEADKSIIDRLFKLFVLFVKF